MNDFRLNDSILTEKNIAVGWNTLTFERNNR